MDEPVIPKIGSVDAAAVGTTEVVAILRPIWRTKPNAAKKVLERIGQTLRYAEALGLDVDARAADKARHVLGDQGHVVTHTPAMPFEEVPALGIDDDIVALRGMIEVLRDLCDRPGPPRCVVAKPTDRTPDQNSRIPRFARTSHPRESAL